MLRSFSSANDDRMSEGRRIGIRNMYDHDLVEVGGLDPLQRRNEYRCHKSDRMKQIPLYLGLGFLAISGLWPTRYSLPKERHRWWNSTVLYNFFSMFMVVGMMGVTTQTFLGLYTYDLPFKEQVVCGCNAYVLLVTVFKMCLFCVRRKDLRRLVARCQEMHEKIQNSTSVEFHTVLRKRSRYGRLLCVACYSVAVTTVLGLWIGPRLEVLLTSPNNSSKEKIFLERYGIPLIEYFPIDIKKHSMFCNFYEIFNCIITSITVFAPDIFVYFVLNALWAHYEVLNVMFADLSITANHFDVDGHDVLGPNDTNTLKVGLDKATRYHIDILDFGKDIESFCSTFMALQILLSGGVSFLIYQMSQLSSVYSPVVIVVVQYFLAGLAVAFLICYFADGVRSKSDSVAFAIYSSDWLQGDTKFRSQIALCIQQSQRPIRLSAAKAVDVSLALFVEIMKKSYSFFTLLKRLESY